MKFVNRIKNISLIASGKCINIGCGENIRYGWVNCDINPISPKVKRLDITLSEDLIWLANTPSNIIECNHVIGYLNYSQAENFFKACYKSLGINGKLVLEFPDLSKISKKILEISEKPISAVDYVELIRGIYAYDNEDAFNISFKKSTYIFGWTENFVRDCLINTNFREVNLCNPLTHGERVWRDSRVEAIK